MVLKGMESFENDPLLQAPLPKFSSAANESKNRSIKRVTYSASNHVQVMFQMYGSVLPQVMPFCLINVLWTTVIDLLRVHSVLDITFQSYTGHSFMGILVSFLVVTRSRISYNRFMEIRRHLGEAYRSCRELVQFSCIYTLDDHSETAQQWRQDVAYQTILLLRVTMEALNWSSTHKEKWDTLATDNALASALDNDSDLDLHAMEMSVRNGDADYGSSGEEEQKQAAKKAANRSRRYELLTSYAHGNRTLLDENFRAPIVRSFSLRQTIASQKKCLGEKLAVNEHRDLLHFVTSYMTAFHGHRVLVFTPYPFPMVQMTRIFLFFWVYSLPLVLLRQMESLVDTLMLVFFMSFGFLGIEYVSMTLDDPFGDDPNDFDDAGLAELVYEDIYIMLYRADGPASASRLRQRVVERFTQGGALQNYRKDVRKDDFWERVL